MVDLKRILGSYEGWRLELRIVDASERTGRCRERSKGHRARFFATVGPGRKKGRKNTHFVCASQVPDVTPLHG